MISLLQDAMPSASQNSEKVFIVGLPRTATTSVCVAMLDLGFKVAHTCYTKHGLDQATVIADTPVFSEYPRLNQAYANNRFVYLQRDMSSWLPSIRTLLTRMHDNLLSDSGGFNPYIKQSFLDVFQPLTLENIASDEFLQLCYERHQQQVEQFCKEQQRPLLSINVSNDDAFTKLCHFVGVKPPAEHPGFQPINVGGKVIAWNKIRHPHKIDATKNGRIDADLFAHLASLSDTN